ncbi:MAG: hypothetical protein BWY06_02478 [Candidatus Latescibacteria bacterium ADurb.Bin168]|nr:MAG: hypothetical protein BWY06_02478 [Candidatus Latescibacteria bacterium ADurb.Bin168]
MVSVAVPLVAIALICTRALYGIAFVCATPATSVTSSESSTGDATAGVAAVSVSPKSVAGT